MESRAIINTENIITTTELFMRIKRLEQELNYHCSDEYSKELKALGILERNVEAVASVSTYQPGSDLVRDSYLEEYKKAVQTLPGTANTGEVLFRPVDFGGITYWLRQ
ncbi:hypothetical protein [Nitrosospira sp. NRS527]|uniref:hypothetical protein n=1 Tax=Nitrosospira sp. NRS527 TaxID=155925 RepID=UPI001AF90C47|nr:hypothetical protein [Nitrosospira sp. NRS527]BCT68207.1 hypothetical protein NNRS527_01799 [Nitrosospira sp. NRS527]